MENLNFRRITEGEFPQLKALSQDILVYSESRGLPFDQDFFLNAVQKLIKETGLTGIIAFKGNTPVGFSWLEFPHGKYGCIVVFTTDEPIKDPMLRNLFQSYPQGHVVLELVTFTNEIGYRETMMQLGFREQMRYRMALSLSNYDVPVPQNNNTISMKPLSPDTLETCARLSYRAHLVSKDQAHNSDFNEETGRLKLEEEIRKGLFGDVIQEGSFIAMQNEVPLGYCVITGTPAWGFDKIGWITDICIEPEKMGKGYGKQLLYHALSNLKKMNIPSVGLAVSHNNPNAKALYEKVGFESFQMFYEYSNQSEI